MLDMPNRCASFKLPVGKSFDELCEDKRENYRKYGRVLRESQRTAQVYQRLGCKHTNLDICKIATFRMELARVPSRTKADMANPAKYSGNRAMKTPKMASPHCVEPAGLVSFWSCTASADTIGRLSSTPCSIVASSYAWALACCPISAAGAMVNERQSGMQKRRELRKNAKETRTRRKVRKHLGA